MLPYWRTCPTQKSNCRNQADWGDKQAIIYIWRLLTYFANAVDLVWGLEGWKDGMSTASGSKGVLFPDRLWVRRASLKYMICVNVDEVEWEWRGGKRIPGRGCGGNCMQGSRGKRGEHRDRKTKEADS